MRKTVLFISIFIVCWLTVATLPTIARAQSCPATSGENYGQLGVPNPFPGDPNNQELNPQPPNRQWTEVNEDKALCQYGYPTNEPPDSTRAPKLSTITGIDPTTPGIFTRTIKVSDSNWPVSFLCVAAKPCDPIRAPATGYDIGGGYNYHVLYADENFITLANFAEDMIQHDASKPETLDVPVLGGYTIHISNIKVDANLLQLYRTLNAQGRHPLPAVKAGQVIGWALGNDYCFSIRDSDDFNDPRSRNDWWGNYMDLSVPYCKGGPSGTRNPKPGVIFQSKQRSPDDREITCQRVAYAADQFNGDPYIYQNKNGQSQPALRTDANLDFKSVSRGVHCGETKSQPLVVTEIAPFDINEGEICKKTWWMAEIGLNYDNNNNFWLPFVQEMADHWAGTLDAEHMKESEIDALFAAAYPDLSLLGGPDKQNIIRDMATASAELKRRQGVLKALLPSETQDNLKCSFVRFVQKKLGSNGGTLYKDFAIEGTKLTDIPCPPTIDNKNLTTASSEYQEWAKTWGTKWQKMGLFPNEKSIGDLRLAICGDKSYYHSWDYPEVFRMGLAANELFKIFTDKAGQDRYYLANGDNNNLKLPLDKNPVLTANLGASLPVEPTLAEISIPSPTPDLSLVAARENSGTKETIFDRFVSFLKTALPDAKSVLAQTIEKYNPLKGKTGGNLLAQTGGGASEPEENQCKVLQDCKASCSLCSKAQLNPSGDNLWPEKYPHGHDVIGMVWNGGGYDPDPIKFDFNIPKWDGTCAGIANVPGCEFKSCSANDESCEQTVCGYGKIDCNKVHDRVIDIYSEVPFLASIWNQTSEVDNGVERACYTNCVNAGSKPEQCKIDCVIPSGFFNIFKPKCDVNDPGCPGYNAGKANGFVGCTTNEKYVFDKEGDFGDSPAASYLTYNLNTFAQGMGVTVPAQFTEGVTVTQKSPKKNEKAKVLFYRLGGMCNTNKWVTEKELNPFSQKESVTSGTAKLINLECAQSDTKISSCLPAICDDPEASGCAGSTAQMWCGDCSNWKGRGGLCGYCLNDTVLRFVYQLNGTSCPGLQSDNVNDCFVEWHQGEPVPSLPPGNYVIYSPGDRCWQPQRADTGGELVVTPGCQLTGSLKCLNGSGTGVKCE